MVFKKDLIKLKNTKYKIHTIRKDIENLEYVKTIKMYKILTQIHLNQKFKKPRIHVRIFLYRTWAITNYYQESMGS